MSLETFSRDALGDEDDPGPVIVVGPAVEPGHRMQEMLRALNHRGAAGLLGDVDQPLDPQKSSAKILGDPVQQKLRLRARQRALAGEHEILDSSTFQRS